jgi:glycyl-tRNA synthetase beta chain
LARTIIESGFDIDLKRLLDRALDAVSFAKTVQKDKAAEKAAAQAREAGVEATATPNAGGTTLADRDELYDFILDRLRGYYADKGVTTTQFNAVAELKPASLYDFDRRIEAIGLFAALPEAATLAAANKRIGNILKKAEAEGFQIPDHINRGLIEHPAEAALAEAVEAAIGDTDTALHQHDYVAVLARLALVREPVDAFFDGVMVNAENEEVRRNRLALLQRLHGRFGAVADIAQLSA